MQAHLAAAEGLLCERLDVILCGVVTQLCKQRRELLQRIPDIIMGRRALNRESARVTQIVTCSSKRIASLSTGVECQ